MKYDMCAGGRKSTNPALVCALKSKSKCDGIDMQSSNATCYMDMIQAANFHQNSLIDDEDDDDYLEPIEVSNLVSCILRFVVLCAIV